MQRFLNRNVWSVRVKPLESERRIKVYDLVELRGNKVANTIRDRLFLKPIRFIFSVIRGVVTVVFSWVKGTRPAERPGNFKFVCV